MKRGALTLVLAAASIWATPKTDSLYAFSGYHGKYAWQRIVCTDENYQPLAAPIHRLMLIDTKAGVEKALADGVYHKYLRISRSGRWLTWNTTTKSAYSSDQDLDRTMIMDLNAATPLPKLLLDKTNCTFWCVRAWWVDPNTGAEYLFCLNNYGPVGGGLVHGNGIYKVPLKSDGTADVANAVKLTISGNPYVDDVLSVSADGKKLGSAFPWPDTKILDIPTGRLDLRHVSGFGCQANLAPDNSYRFFHCESDHWGIYMFAANMVNQNWFVDLNKNLADLPVGKKVDFAAPRWTNKVEYFTNSYPLGVDDDLVPMYTWEWSYQGKSAAEIKTYVLYKAPGFVLEKFTPDYKSVEKSIAIAHDIRYIQYGGDGWLEGSASTAASAAPKWGISRSRSTPGLGPDRGICRITNSLGRVVYQAPAAGQSTLDTRALEPGVYVTFSGAAGAGSRQVTVTR